MSKILTTVWEAEPHTIAKLAILKGYLNAWFAIMGRIANGDDLFLIDGFAGPGEYTNFPNGSPIFALDTAIKAMENIGDAWKAGKVRFYFIEKDKRRYGNLKRMIQAGGYCNKKNVSISCYNGSFKEKFPIIRKCAEAAFKTSPLFVFIDPFGVKGVPFRIIKEVLSSSRSEVFLNLDCDGIARNFYVPKNAHVLREVFGDDSWRDLRSYLDDFKILCTKIRDHYVSTLRSIPSVEWIFPFEMCSKVGITNYHLVFASRHKEGLRKMKESMKRQDRSGGFTFVEADQYQGLLFKSGTLDEDADITFSEFRGRKVSYDDVDSFVLKYPYQINPKSILKKLENDGKITVSGDPSRRKGTFNPEKILSIEFHTS